MAWSDASDPPLTKAPVNVIVPVALAVIVLALLVAAAAWLRARHKREAEEARMLAQPLYGFLPAKPPAYLYANPIYQDPAV